MHAETTRITSCSFQVDGLSSAYTRTYVHLCMYVALWLYVLASLCSSCVCKLVASCESWCIGLHGWKTLVHQLSYIRSSPFNGTHDMFWWCCPLAGAPIGDQMEIARNETVADNKPRLIILEQPKAVSFHPRVACSQPALHPCCAVQTTYIHMYVQCC